MAPLTKLAGALFRRAGLSDLDNLSAHRADPSFSPSKISTMGRICPATKFTETTLEALSSRPCRLRREARLHSGACGNRDAAMPAEFACSWGTHGQELYGTRQLNSGLLSTGGGNLLLMADRRRVWRQAGGAHNRKLRRPAASGENLSCPCSFLTCLSRQLGPSLPAPPLRGQRACASPTAAQALREESNAPGLQFIQSAETGRASRQSVRRRLTPEPYDMSDTDGGQSTVTGALGMPQPARDR